MKYPNVRSAMFAACVLMAAAAPAVAAPIVYTDRAAFLAATTGAVVSDFSGLGNASTQSNPYSEANWSLSTNAIIISFDPNSSPDYQFNSGKVLALAGASPTAGTFTLNAGVTAFGFDYGVRAANAGAAVTINGVNYTAPGAPTLSFYGIVDSAGVAPITVSFAAARGIFDNVTVAAARPVVTPPGPGAVPEPATWAMLLLGFAAVGGTLRRRPSHMRIRFA